jgi:hypothetical protein
MSFSQPQLAGISSLLGNSTLASTPASYLKRLSEEGRPVKLTHSSSHHRILSKGSVRSLQSKTRDCESRDDFALGEYRKQEIRRARGMINSQFPYWFIDSWLEDEAADKKLSRLCTPRGDLTLSGRHRLLKWSQELSEKLEISKFRAR